jgi:integrase/recombinase XerC
MSIPQMEENQISAARMEITEALYTRFLAYLDMKPKTVQTYTRSLRQFFRYLSQNDITKPRREDILAFRARLFENHRPTTVQSYITAVRLFFQWTALEGFYPNVAERVKGARLTKEHRKDYLTSAQVKTVMGEIDRRSVCGLRDYALFAVMVTGGLRTIEAARANIGDMGAIGDFSVLYIQGKGSDEKSEYVKLHPHVECAIREYLKERGVAGRSAPLFASTSNNSAGRRLTTRSISGIVKTRLRAAGYDSERLTAHSLRHTAVTLSILSGRRLDEVQQFARHANISTTQIYNHALDRAQNGCAEAVAEAIF